MSDEQVTAKEEVDEQIDVIAEICQYWRRHRSSGRTPSTIRAALLQAFSEALAEPSPEVRAKCIGVIDWGDERTMAMALEMPSAARLVMGKEYLIRPAVTKGPSEGVA